MENYNTYEHTRPFLEKMLENDSLQEEIKMLRANIEANREAMKGKSEGEILHAVLEGLYDYQQSNGEFSIPLFDFIYDVLGTSAVADYFKEEIQPDELKKYQSICEVDRQSRPEFQGNEARLDSYEYMKQHPGDYLMCHTVVKQDATERIILNFVSQRDAFEFVKAFRDRAESVASFKVCLGGPCQEGILKNDKVVIYYPGERRKIIIEQITFALKGISVGGPLSGFYHKIQEGMGLAPETNSNWSFTMYTSEYLCGYLLENSEYNPKDMYNFVMSKLPLPKDFVWQEVR